MAGSILNECIARKPVSFGHHCGCPRRDFVAKPPRPLSLIAAFRGSRSIEEMISMRKTLALLTALVSLGLYQLKMRMPERSTYSSVCAWRATKAVSHMTLMFVGPSSLPTTSKVLNFRKVLYTQIRNSSRARHQRLEYSAISQEHKIADLTVDRSISQMF